MKLSLIKTRIKNKHVVEAYERLESSRNLKQLIFSTLSEFGNLKHYSAFINEDNVLQGVLNLMNMVKKLNNQSQRFHGHVVVRELDTLLNSCFQFWIKEPVEATLPITPVDSVAREQNDGVDCSFNDTSQFFPSRIRNSYVLETFRLKKGDALKTHEYLCKWAGLSPEKVHMINFTKAMKNVVQKADELKDGDVAQLNSFLKEFFKFPLVAETKGQEEKTLTDSLIKTRIKNKYVMEAYERLKARENLKQLIYSSLSDLGNFAHYSEFIDEDNVLQGVMNMMEMVKKLQGQKSRSKRVYKGLQELDTFMNSNFQFWIRKPVERETAMCEGLAENDTFSESLLVLNEDTSEMSMVSSNRVENCCKPSDNHGGTKAKTKRQSKAKHGPAMFHYSNIRIGHVIETFRLKKEDGLKTHDCLCKWEGIAPEKVHVQNFIEDVNNIVRKADALKRTDIALYKSFMKEFFKFPLLETLESDRVPRKGRKSKCKKMKEEHLEKKSEDSPNKSDGDTDKRTREGGENETTHEENGPSENDERKGEKRNKRNTSETTHGENGTLENDERKGKKRTKRNTSETIHEENGTSENDERKGKKRTRQNTIDESAVSDVIVKQMITKPKHRTMLQKKRSKQAMLELQLKMKLQYQTKLKHLIKRQNSIIVRQRKQIRALKRRRTGAPTDSVSKGVQCSLISATPKTVLVRVLKT